MPLPPDDATFDTPGVRHMAADAYAAAIADMPLLLRYFDFAFFFIYYDAITPVCFFCLYFSCQRFCRY